MAIVKIQLELPEDGADELEDLMRQTGMTTTKDLLNEAVTLFQWAVRERRSGRVIASVDAENGRYKELEMPSLEKAATIRTASAAF